jgi:hypothetical protein
MLESADMLAAYRRGTADLEAAVADCRDIDARRASGEWSTRMILHHLADGEALWLQPLKLALLQDGFEYRHNVWVQEGSGEALAYATRDVAPSVALFRSRREHAGILLAAIPDAMERHVMFAWGDQQRRVTVADIVNMQIGHLATHIAEIQANAEKAADD